MIKRLIPLVVVLLTLPLLTFGQTPRNIQIKKTNNSASSTNHSSAVMCEAGSITFGTFTGQSNDTDDTVKYLCADDCLNIIHDGNFQHDDPDTSTPPGIGYVFYDCPPSVMGPTITDVINDPCTNKTDPIVVFPNDTIFQQGGLWIAADQANGDAKFTNNGNLQLAFTENRSDPIQFWFAPTTVHLFDPSNPQFEESVGVPGCVDVSTDQAFSVVYLNAIEITNKKAVLGGGEFTARRGLPEFDDNATSYTITITKIDDPSVMGTVTSGNTGHSDLVTFTVPEEGCYDILVEDGKSCFAMEQLCTYMSPQFTFELPSVSVPPGAMTCLSASISGFEDVVSFQLGIAYDSTVLDYTSTTQGADIPPTSILEGALPITMEPNVGIAWNDFAGIPVTFPDGTVAFDICFDAVGAVGECSDLEIVDLASGLMLEVSGIINQFDESFINIVNGEICIESNDLDIVFSDIIPDCSNGGGFTITVNQGFPPYSVTWEDSNGDVFGPQVISANGGSTTLTGLQAGTYMVTVGDNDVPTVFVTGSVEVPVGDLAVNIIQDSIPCFGQNNGVASSTILVGGVADPNPDPSQYTFSWEQGGMVIGTDPVVSNVGSGAPVEITVTDNASGCAATASLTLAQFPEIVIDSVRQTNPECPGFSNGEVSVFVSGGSGTYLYDWDSDLDTGNPVLFGIGAGSYTVSVTDDRGCGPVETTITLQDPPSVGVTFSAIQDVSCFDAVLCDGSITATGEGGQGGPYTFIWSSGDVETDVMSSTVSTYCAGQHSVAVSEGNCGIDTTFMIGSPDSLGLDIENTITTPISCFGLTDGQIEVAAEGGTPGYTYSWDINGTATTGSMVTGLAPGSYVVTIEDANGCSQNIPLIVGDKEALQVLVDTALTTTTVACAGDENGVISVFPMGGNIGTMTYDWSPNVSDLPTATALPAGDYTVTVTDMLGCTGQSPVITIGEPDAVLATIPQPAPPACAGQRTTLVVASAEGGVGGPYTFSINNGIPGSIANGVDLLAGEYLVSVLDANQCAYEEVITIDEPAPLIVDLGEDVEIELGESTQLDGFFFGPNAPDSIIWSPTIMCADSSMMDCLDPIVAPVETTEYTLTIIDELGCVGSDNIIVEVDSDRNVYIPNVFTPDNDGVNDFFSPYIGPGVSNVKSMRIYDRWGELLYEQLDFLPFNDFDFGWNGTFRNKRVQTGVYVYLIEVEFLDGISLLYRGDVLAIY